jgi:hypothetical protein
MVLRIAGRRARLAGLVLGLLAAFPLVASAQTREEPIGRFAADVHVASLKYNQGPEMSTSMGVDASDLPGRGFGLDVGAHYYPFSWKKITFGVGGSLHSSRGHHPADDVDGTISGTDVVSRFTAISPQVSLNFGHRRGWSYISFGLLSSTMTYSVAEVPVDIAIPRRKTINYGGGARWFTHDHFGYSFDVRFYAINPVAVTAETRMYPRMTLIVVSGGVSFK